MTRTNLTRTPYLVLFIVLGAVGVSVAYAVGNVIIEGNMTVTGDTELDGKLLDSNDDAGNAGQVLSSTETGIDWIDTTGATIQRENSVFLPERGGGIPNRDIKTVAVNCQAGEIVTGGGWSLSDAINPTANVDRAKVFFSENRKVGNGWQITGFNEENNDQGVTLTVYAECLQLSAP